MGGCNQTRASQGVGGWHSLHTRAHLITARESSPGEAAETAGDVTNNTTLIKYLYMWKGQDAKTIGKKAYQIAECLRLLSVNQKLCRKIQEIAKDFPDCEIPEKRLDELCLNPWIKQYMELFH